MRLLFYLKAQ